MLRSRLLRNKNNHFTFQNIKCLLNFSQSPPNYRKLRYPLNKGQIQVLMNIWGVKYSKAYGVSRQHTNLRTIDQISLCESSIMLKNFGITQEELLKYPQLLSLPPPTIENRAFLLQEAGFTSMRPSHFISFGKMMGKPVKLFKVYNYIPQDVQVENNFFNYLENPPPPLELPNSDDSEFLVVYMAAFSHYLCWRLEMSKEVLERILLVYPRLQRRSFRLVESSLNILENELGFTKDKIKRHAYLICSHPRNTSNTLKIKSLGGVEIKTLLQKIPKVVMMPTQTLIKTEECLQEFGIPESAIQRCLNVYTLSSETVKERLHALQNVPEFMGLFTNPRVLSLVHSQRKACSRLDYLERIKKCASLHILQTSQPIFEKFLRDGTDRSPGIDVITFLSNELKSDREELRKMLHRHPYWCNVPLVTVHETFKFLQSKGFTKEQIMTNIQVLLYSSKQVRKQLEELPYHPELHKEMLRQNELEKGNELEFSREQQLALCLYFIERDHHFSGDGIWFENPYIVATDETTA